MRTYLLFPSKFSFLILFISLIIISCDNKQEECIPYNYVDFTVALYVNNHLTTPNNSMIFQGVGYGGVIIYCGIYDYSTPDNSIYYAYDATCPLEVADTCMITDIGDNFYGECPCCHTKYDLSNGIGNPIDGNAPCSLKRYNVTVYNDVLHVTN
jgi:hypothetical protein